jgi:hypothetical protein
MEDRWNSRPTYRSSYFQTLRRGTIEPGSATPVGADAPRSGRISLLTTQCLHIAGFAPTLTADVIRDRRACGFPAIIPDENRPQESRAQPPARHVAAHASDALARDIMQALRGFLGDLNPLTRSFAYPTVADCTAPLPRHRRRPTVSRAPMMSRPCPRDRQNLTLSRRGRLRKV